MQTLSEEYPVARKQHRCSACYGRIEPGTRYFSGACTDSGDFWLWKECPSCYWLLRESDSWDWFFDEGDQIFPEGCVHENFGEYREAGHPLPPEDYVIPAPASSAAQSRPGGIKENQQQDSLPGGRAASADPSSRIPHSSVEPEAKPGGPA